MAILGSMACGEVKGTPIDGPPIDIDAAIDAPPAPVRVTVLNSLGDGLPDVTAKVLFQDPQGALVVEVPVDAMGKAEAMLPLGGSVTVVRVTTDNPTQLFAVLTTVTAVKPGDDLTVGRKAAATITSQGGQTQMTATFFPTGDATSYQFFHTCGTSFASTSPVTLTFRDSCHGATFDLIGVASGGTLTTPRFFRVQNINYSAGGSFTIPVGFSTMSNFTVNVMNTPADVSNISMTRSSMIENQAVAGQGVVGVPAAGTVSMVVPHPTSAGTRSQVQVFYNRTGATSSMRHEMHTSTIATPVNIDLAQLEIPWLATPAMTATGGTWTAVTTAGTPDGQVMSYAGRWMEPTRLVTVSWRLIGPASMTGMQLPRLPAAYAHLDPQAQSVPVNIFTGSLTMVDYDVVAGYDEFRPLAETLVEASFDDKGAFAGMPHQRRMSSMSLPAASPMAAVP